MILRLLDEGYTVSGDRSGAIPRDKHGEMVQPPTYEKLDVKSTHAQ